MLHLVLCIFLNNVLNTVCLDENFDYWYSNDDGLVPGHSYISERTQNNTSKRHFSDDDGLTEDIPSKDYTKPFQIVRHSLNTDSQCINLLCSLECLDGRKQSLGICKYNRCLCNSGYPKLRTYSNNYIDNRY